MKIVRRQGQNRSSWKWSLARTRLVFPVLVGVALVLDGLVVAVPAGADPDVLNPVAGNDTSGVPTSGQLGSGQSIGYPNDLAVDAQGNVYFADIYDYQIDVVNASTGLLTVLAGTGTEGIPTSGEPAAGQAIGDPYALTVDSQGNIYFVDDTNDTIDEISAPTINGLGVVTSGGELTVLATSSQGVDLPFDIAVDSSGNVFFANGNYSIAEISHATGLTTFVAGTGSEGTPTTGSSGYSQSIGNPFHLAVDSLGNLYFGDTTNDEVDELSAPVLNSSGDVTGGDVLNVLAGSGSEGTPTTGSSGVGQSIGQPLSVTVDSSGKVYFVDGNNFEVDELSAGSYTDGVLTGGDVLNILAGDGFVFVVTSGEVGFGQSAGEPLSVAVDSLGNVYFSDGYDDEVDQLSTGSYTDGVLTGGDVLTILAESGYPQDTRVGDNVPPAVTNLAVTGSGLLYVADESNDNNTYYVESFPLTAPPAPIAFDTVTYSAGAGTGTVPTQDPVVDLGTFTVASGGSLSNPGYSFAGWSDGTTTYQPGATYTVGSAPVTLTAVWKAVSLVPVTYANGGGTGTLPTQGAVQAGTTITVASGAGLSDPGYTFAGWSDGTTTYQPGDAYTVGGSPVTFTAQWKSSSSSSSGSSTSHLSDTVYFALDSSTLTPADRASLSAFAVKVKNANVSSLDVVGYTDPTGTEPLNHVLSIQRARSIAAALTKDLNKLGVTSVSIHASGAGVSHTYTNAALDRRGTVTS